MTGLPARFWSKVDVTPDHWLWTRSTSKGYGQVKVGGRSGRKMAAHRLTYADAYGAIPPGMEIDHRCRVRRCVNPSHLRMVTHGQNCENMPARPSRSGARNVHWNELLGKWRVKVTRNRRTVDGGLYATIEEADRAARALRDQIFTHHTDGLAS